MFVVHAHPSRYHQRPRAFNPFELVLEQAQYSFAPEPALVDPVEVARARYMHALDEQRAARQAYAVHHLRTFQDEAAAYLRQQQQQQQQQVLAAREEARQRAVHARRQQIIQARREEELRRRRQEREENEFAQALMLAFELANQVQVQHPPVERAPAPARCACANATATPVASAAPRNVHRASSVPVLAPPPRPSPAPQPRVRFSPPQAASHAPGIPVSRPAATPVPLRSVLKPTAPPTASPASVRIPIRESKGKASSHVRVNVTATPETQPALSPADAIAALMMLEADLDALTPATTATPLLKHQLNTILESVDAIESGGHDAVRDVRRALVQRIEEALVAAERGEAAFALPQRAAGMTINEPTSTRIEVKVRPEPADVEPVSIPVLVREPVATPPSVVVDDLVDVSQPGPAELDVVPTPSAAVEGYVVDDFLVPEVSAPADAIPVVSQHNEQSGDAEPVEDALDELAPATLEPSASSTPLTAEFVTSPVVNEPAADERDVQATIVANETVPQDLPDAVSDEGSTSPDADAVDEPITAPSAAESSTTPTSLEPAADAVTGDEARATPGEPTTIASAASRTPSPAPPGETPLAASYPPAQTFAAPTHPPVDAGSDGEWERTSGSEGEKSDYEVV